GHVIDTSVVTTTYSGAITGTQYNFQVVPEQYVLFGENPSVTFTTDNSGISTIDHLGNTTFVSTGEYRVIGSYVQNSFYEGLTVEYPIINYSGGGEVVLETQYINDPVNISNHVLIVYNSGTQTSTNLKHYYT